MRLRMALLALSLVAGLALPAAAGGDGYDAADEPADAGPVFYGAVRDSRGLGVAGAEVVLRPRQGEPVTVRTNLLGLYRSHVAKDAVPAEVEVNCIKVGYRQSGLQRRSSQGNGQVNETNCTMQRL